MRGSRLFALLVLCAAGLTPVAAGELEDIVAGNVAARGGEDKLQALRSARMTGKIVFTGAGMEAPIRFIWKAPNKLRTEFDFQGSTAYQTYDGKQGWSMMPFQGQSEPELIEGQDLFLLEQQADFPGPFVDTAKKGYLLESLGREDVDGTAADKIKVTDKHGGEQIVWLGAEHHLQIKSEMKRNTPAGEIDIETTHGDYREVDGLRFAHSIESKPKGMPGGQVFVLEQIELNVDIPDSTFAGPGPAAAAEGE